jgi:membrane protease YdiL (CAAX protease family)
MEESQSIATRYRHALEDAGCKRPDSETQSAGIRGDDMIQAAPATRIRRANAALLPLLEITAMTVMLLAYIWLWQDRFPGADFICLALYFGIGIAGHWYRGESAHQIGLRTDNLKAAALDALPIMVPIVVVVLLIGLAAHSIHFPPVETWPARLASGWLWGTMQQYGLTAFFNRRLFDALSSHRAASLAAAALFALFHLPNTFLMGLTFGAGLLACWLYRREPNLPVLGAVHAVISFFVLGALPDWLTLRLRVGP